MFRPGALAAPQEGDPGARGFRGVFQRWAASIPVRLAVLLTLALVPLGLIAVSQTDQLQAELDRVRALNLQVVTTDTARREGKAIDSAFGLGAGLASGLLAAQPDPATCTAALNNVASRYDGRISFLGFVPVDGIMLCATRGAPRDMSALAEFDAWMEHREAFVNSSHHGQISGRAVITVHTPVFDPEDAFLGFVSLSLVERGPLGDSLSVPGAEMFDFVIVDEEGAILDASAAGADGSRLLPLDFDARAMESLSGQTLVADTAVGETRRFAVAEMVAGVGYVIGSQPVMNDGPISRLIAPETFPVFMWLVSLALVFGVVEASLVGPVRGMSARMRRFGETRRLTDGKGRRPLPLELQAMDATFTATAERLLREEAELKDALHNREVLLKEVHHRVKNNLQMISSMISLQVREVDTPETREALEKVSGRIASLAAVHRQVYSADRAGAVQADDLLREVVLPLSEAILAELPSDARPEVTLELFPVLLTPDQAVPAAMLVVEALTSAVRAATPDDTGARWVKVGLSSRSPGKGAAGGGEAGGGKAGGRGAGSAEAAKNGDIEVAMRISRSGQNVPDGGTEGPPDLGERLIRGFARQLRGTIEIGWEGAAHVVSIRFHALPFSPEDDSTGQRGSHVGDGAMQR